MEQYIKIAIDGPSGAGKSTISRRVADELGFMYADTGAIYRAIGAYMTERGISCSDHDAVIAALPSADVCLEYRDGEQHVFINGGDMTGRIRSPEISAAASAVSAIPEVREKLLEIQREAAVNNNIIMDGRDIGTKVLPDARIKIFLTATPEDRARRRYEEMLGKGEEASFDAVLKAVNERDYNDSHRKADPLRQAEDALFVDTTGNTFEQSVALIKKIITERLSHVV